MPKGLSESAKALNERRKTKKTEAAASLLKDSRR